MRRHAKALTAGSNLRRAKGLGHVLRGALLTADASRRATGTRAARGLTTALASLLLLGLLAAPAFAAEPPEYHSSFGPDGTESTDFERASSLAIDQEAQEIYVADLERGSIFKFKINEESVEPLDFGGSADYITGNELTGIDYVKELGIDQIAVDSASHTIYVTADEGKSLLAFQPNGEPSLFTGGPGSGTNEISGFMKLWGLAVDTGGRIYASENNGGSIKIYEPSGELLTEFGVTNPANIAVDGNGAVYVNRQAETVLKFIPSEYPVTASTTYTAAAEPLDPKSSFTVAVDPLTNDVYVAHDIISLGVAWYDASGALQATFAQPGEAGEVRLVDGVGVGAGERVFLSDTPGGGSSQVKIFGPEIPPPLAPPSVKALAVTEVAATSARVVAKINPNSVATTYRFEYGLADCAISPCTGVPVDDVAIGSGHEFVPVSQQIVGLQPNTTYHYRVVAENDEGDNLGTETDYTFTTQGSGLNFKLADSRAWEMVSPPNKLGGRLAEPEKGHIQASADGSGVAYLTHNPIELDPEGNRMIEPSSVLARRGEGGDWSSKDITSPNGKVTPVVSGEQAEYKLFSADLSMAMIEPRSGTPLSPQTSEQTPYLRENTEPPTYTPLVTGKEGFANVPPGTVFGGLGSDRGVSLQAANSSLSNIVLESRVPLVPGAGQNSLYRWAAGQLQVVSVLPAAEGGGMATLPVIGSRSKSVRHAISEDGSRVFWSQALGDDDQAEALYMRDMEAEETARLDAVQSGASGLGAASPIFQGASADGSVVFFTDTQQLTKDASPSGLNVGPDLYRCEISPSGCSTLTNITGSTEEESERAEVQGIASAISEDGSAVYFTAKAVLDATPNEAGDSAEPGGFNLYLWKQGEGARFIAPLEEEDKGVWGVDGRASLLTAEGSPNGRYLAFRSELDLAGQGNEDPQSGEPVKELFRYDAVEGRLHCVSCNPTGAAPEGQSDGVAATVPATSVMQVATISPYQPRFMLDNGRVFFNASDSLVPADSNGQWDVYQYESTGVGDCTASSASASVARSGDGCISLISSGTAEEEASLLDTSTSGDDVFFFTSARLSVTDEDFELDLYDARVDGIPARLSPSAECLGEACQPAAIAPNDPTPASSSFKGQGNQKPNVRKRCAKGKRVVRRGGKARCVVRKQHKRVGKSGRESR